MSASESRGRQPRAPSTRADLEHWSLAEELHGLCRKVDELHTAVRTYGHALGHTVQEYCAIRDARAAGTSQVTNARSNR
jgi:hypothetical protein